MTENMSRYPKRKRQQVSTFSTASASSISSISSSPSSSRSEVGRGKVPMGRVLVVHANVKEYGRGAKGSKESNRRDFAFSAAEYVKMRDSGKPYPAFRNKLLPLPRPTYTEFVNRAKRARMLDRLDFLFVSPEAPQPPRAIDVHYADYERVVWSGVSFRRFAKLWTPERHCFFTRRFRAVVFTFLLVKLRAQMQLEGQTSNMTGEDGGSGVLARLPEDCLYSILAFSAGPKDSTVDGYDTIETVHSGAHHVFLPAPGSSGIREALFDAVFGL